MTESAASAAALATWARRVTANRDQAERVRETPPGGDFYAPVSAVFAVDPRRTDDPVLDALLALAAPDETWLDIGAGAGRFALPLALRLAEGGGAGRVVAIDPSPSMLAGLRDGMARHGIANVEPIEGRWPPAPGSAAEAAATADVALIAQVGYDIAEIGPFLDAMERAARRACVAILSSNAPSAMAGSLWPAVHREERAELPALADLLVILRARGRSPDVHPFGGPARTYRSRDDLLRWARQQTFVAPGSAADERLLAELDRRIIVEGDSLRLAGALPLDVSLVTWEPR